jgi:hypothetical protein
MRVFAIVALTPLQLFPANALHNALDVALRQRRPAPLRVPAKKKLIDDTGINTVSEQMPAQLGSGVVATASVNAVGSDVLPVLCGPCASVAASVDAKTDQPRRRIGNGVAAVN